MTLNDEDLGYGPPTHVKDRDERENQHPVNINELKASMRKASMGYRRASMEFRRASLCHSSNASNSIGANTLKFQPRRGSQDSTVSALTVDKAISDQALIDAAMPWEYDLEYGWLTSPGKEPEAPAVPDKEQEQEPGTDKDGNIISELSFKNRRASLEYRKASMAFRRASGDSKGRRGSIRNSRQESDYENPEQQHFYCSGGLDGSVKSATSLDPSDAPGGVFFGEVEIIEFPLIIGDNPACSGCPTTLDWEPVSRKVEDIMYHEFVRGPRRRTRKQLKVSKKDQYHFLMKSGYSMDTIISTEEECQKIRKQRYETLKAERQFDAFTMVFARAKGNLEQSIKDGSKAIDNIVPNSMEKMGQMGHQVSEAVTSTANLIVSPFAKVGQKMSSAVQKTTSRMSIIRKQPLGT